MKYSEAWVRERVNPHETIDVLGDKLTMAGLEVESIMPAAQPFTGVVVGELLKVEVIDETSLNRLSIDVGKKKPLQILSSAPNLVETSKLAVALPGAILPNEQIVKETLIHGEVSQGMICSAKELGLSDEAEEVLSLPHACVNGSALWDVLQLDDHVLELGITPNRGDCLSIKGLAREINAITGAKLKENVIESVPAESSEQRNVKIRKDANAKRYIGRVIQNIYIDVQTPLLIRERLRRSDIRSINPVVDITNYVMLELGQPMHAFDLSEIKGSILVRSALPNETLKLLNGLKVNLDEEIMVIADEEKPLAIAGVMGGIDSSVKTVTESIFLESAYFSPEAVAQSRQKLGITSDSAYRFERGIDPTIQADAMEYATKLILDICGGMPGPLVEVVEAHFPGKTSIHIGLKKINRVLGTTLKPRAVEDIFKRLNLEIFNKEKDTLPSWDVYVPPYRHDLKCAEDLIEEIARLHGYDNIPALPLEGNISLPIEGDHQGLTWVRTTLTNKGFHEIVTYSFVDEKLQNLIDDDLKPRKLVNPINQDMEVMRTSLWGGLLQTYRYNASRQKSRVRLFEVGRVFLPRDDQYIESEQVAGLISGLEWPEQWSLKKRPVDFFDLKGIVESILSHFYPPERVTFTQASLAILHPAQSAYIVVNDKIIGALGRLHPSKAHELDLQSELYLFKIDTKALKNQKNVQYSEVSKFPEIRRDLALIVNEAIPSKAIQDTIRDSAGDWLKDVFVFDVYQGKGIAPGQKSIALGLILKHPTRTLIDDEVNERMESIQDALKRQLGAELRS